MYRNKLFVIGGRAREHARMADERIVGGVAGARMVPPSAMGQVVGREDLPGYSAWRETAALKNDVWVSVDGGASWKLIQAGCKSNQRELLLRDRYSTDAEEALAKMFNPALQCASDADCYGTQEVCEAGVCLCQFWSPREQHRVAVYGGYMYLLGGFASRHQNYCDGKVCGDVDAGGYRQYMNDVWYSRLEGQGDQAGATWQALTTGAPWAGRGGHAVAKVQLLPVDGSRFALYVIGGRSGSVDVKNADVALDDVWSMSAERESGSTPSRWPASPLSRRTRRPSKPSLRRYAEFPPAGEDPVGYISAGSWKRAFPEGVPWAGRTGHAAVVDVPASINMFTQRLYLIGGEDADGNLLDDVWSWGWECRDTGAAVGVDNGRGICNPTETADDPTVNAPPGELENASSWRKDYEAEALFRLESGANKIYDAGSPQRHYVDPDSSVAKLVKVYLPLDPDDASYAEEEGYPSKFYDDVDTSLTASFSGIFRSFQ